MKFFLETLLFFFLPLCLAAQQPADTTNKIIPAPVIPAAAEIYKASLDSFFSGHLFMAIPKDPVRQATVLHHPKNNDHLFYLVIGLVLLLGCLRFFYSRYVITLFRVFFNSSLRQSQLTDQLLQAKLPSLLFNIFFVLSGGYFIFFVLRFYGYITDNDTWWIVLPVCIGSVAVIYTVKFFTLIFTGWITSYKEAAHNYIFIIFLINKVIGILLVPVTVLLAFSESQVGRHVVIPALVATGLLLLIRFFRSYGLLQGTLKISRFHFLMYITGIELLPILLIYKALMLYLDKSL